MVEEVRRQFREIPGIMEYKAEPEYDKCVGISTTSALHEMMTPGVLPSSCRSSSAASTCDARRLPRRRRRHRMLMAIFMSNAGGAWDNAKKYIEQGFTAARARCP